MAEKVIRGDLQGVRMAVECDLSWIFQRKVDCAIAPPNAKSSRGLGQMGCGQLTVMDQCGARLGSSSGFVLSANLVQTNRTMMLNSDPVLVRSTEVDAEPPIGFFAIFRASCKRQKAVLRTQRPGSIRDFADQALISRKADNHR